VVAHEFAFDEIADAHRMLEERRNVGKVVVRVG
jgi:NADPH:quinone reductase-like Zn-dependent oxidoreductase